MRGAHRTPVATVARTSAVAWIDARTAVVARSIAGDVALTEVRAHDGGHDPTYLARVVDAIGDQDRLVITGSDPVRLALEREYVTIYHRPDRLVDVEAAQPLDRWALAERARAIAG